MKRFHVHLHVANLEKSIGFYSKLFASEPTRIEGDYAKWMLEDPPLNFAISTRGAQAGINHLGIQTDDPGELAAMKARAEAADLALLDEGETTCCYARSEKHWSPTHRALPGNTSTRWQHPGLQRVGRAGTRGLGLLRPQRRTRRSTHRRGRRTRRLLHAGAARQAVAIPVKSSSPSSSSSCC